VSTAESEELKRLRRENAELRRANEILKTASRRERVRIPRERQHRWGRPKAA